jgi:undecaprenyl-diphosphatase
MSLIQIVILALVQGAAELLPVSSSAHVIVAEKLMSLDPAAPDMTFFLVMLHTGTMFAAIAYFGRRWLSLLSFSFVKLIVLATAATGVVGLVLKKIVEAAIAPQASGPAEIEQLFSNLPLIAGALFCAGVLILAASRVSSRLGGRAASIAQAGSDTTVSSLTTRSAGLIGAIQGACLPFRGFSRSGATISMGMLAGVERRLAEEFSFALAVVLTPVAIARELHRFHKATGGLTPTSLTPGLIGMVFAFAAGLGALKWLSSWLEHGKWKLFGYYCLAFSLVVGVLAYGGL